MNSLYTLCFLHWLLESKLDQKYGIVLVHAHCGMGKERLEDPVYVSDLDPLPWIWCTWSAEQQAQTCDIHHETQTPQGKQGEWRKSKPRLRVSRPVNEESHFDSKCPTAEALGPTNCWVCYLLPHVQGGTAQSTEDVHDHSLHDLQLLQKKNNMAMVQQGTPELPKAAVIFFLKSTSPLHFLVI